LALKPGDIIFDYSYLWLRQKRAGETEGRKPRPVCVAIAVKNVDGETHLALLPISSQPPQRGQRAIKLTQSEMQKIDLENGKDAWVYVSEYNYDVVEHSFYLKRKAGRPHSLSPEFMKQVLRGFRVTLQSKAGRVSRAE
jgi:hypothetical protein